MPTEEELEQMVTEHIDKERDDSNENISGLSKGTGRKQAD